MATPAGIKLVVEGERQFKKTITDINYDLKVLTSEMRIVESQFGKNATSTEAMAAKNRILNRQIDAQNRKLKS